MRFFAIQLLMDSKIDRKPDDTPGKVRYALPGERSKKNKLVFEHNHISFVPGGKYEYP
jgi:hypothetical protein